MTSFKINYLLRVLPPNVVTLGVRVSVFQFGEHTVESVARAYYTVRLERKVDSIMQCLVRNFNFI